MELSMIYALVGGLVVGVVIGYLLRMVLHQNKSADGQPERAQAELESARHEIIRFQSELERIQKESAKDREQLMEVNSQKAGLQSDLTHLYEKLKNQKEEVTTLQEQFAVRFKHLAQEILEEKSKKFTDQNKSNIGELLNPLKEKIDKFEKRVEESNIQNVKMSSSLTEQIKGLKELNQQMTKDTVNLTKALRGDSKTQGNWGEMQLEIILEKA
ncbi:MAG: DNA recombination protein RmuC, partial [Cyclobacteriaceae bacterium]